MPTESSSAEIELTLNEALNSNLDSKPGQRLFGNAPDIEKNNITVRIGANPIVVDLVRLYQQRDRKLPEELTFYPDHYRLWMITHHVNVAEEPGHNQVRQLVFEARLPDKGRQPEFTIVSVLPQTEFVTKLQVNQTIECSADLDLSAGAKLPDALTQLLDQFDGAVSGTAGAKLQLSNTSRIIGRLSFAVATPTISAIGEGDTYCHWMLRKVDRSLTGGHSFVQIALVPEVVKRVSMECRVSAVISSAFGLFPDKRRSGWANLVCSYPKPSTSIAEKTVQ